MKSTPHHTEKGSRPSRWTALKNTAARRRTDRIARRTLEQELGSYTTQRDIDDLLAAVHARGDDSQIRSMLVRAR